MPIRTTYTKAKVHFPQIWDEVANNRETVIIRRRGAEDVALVPASELTGLLETAHLFRSPANAERLLQALERVRSGQGKPQSPESLKKEMGLE